MMKLFLLFFVSLIAACSAHKNKSINYRSANSYSLQGKIEGRDSGVVFLGTYDTTQNGPLIILDSAKVSGSYFHFNGVLSKPLICKLKISEQAFAWPYTHYFVLDTGITSVRLFKDSMANSIISGSALNEQLMTFNKKLYDIEVDYEKYFPLNKQGIISDDSLQILEKAFLGKKHDLILEQIHANPKAITSGFMAREVLNEVIELPAFEEICDALENADNYFARSLFSQLAARKRTIIGMKAPSFEITGDKNRTFTNDSFKGKYLLIDFWASWCPPCREENPTLVSAYKLYGGRGLEMMSVSVDYNKSEWEKAIKEDKLSWIQALIGPNSKTGKDFGIYFYPSNLLIDPEGTIIAKDLTGADLEKTLGEHLKNN